MPVTKWIRHPTFPAANAPTTKDGAVGTVRLREWAVGKLIAQGLVSGESVRSSTSTVIAGSNMRDAPGRITMDFRTGEVSFVALDPGATLIYPVNGKGELVGPGLTIVVQLRRATQVYQRSLATLSGKTFAINAPDARTYIMEKTHTFNSALDPVRVFDDVPSATDHVVVSSHGRIPDDLAGDTNANFSLMIAGDNKENQKRRLDLTNVEAAFQPLTTKLTKHAVIWLGSCSIGNNDAFCHRAANASGRTIVAPTSFCPIVKYPKNTIDLLDREAGVKVFAPGKERTLKHLRDFCAEQVARKFSVPI